MDLILIIVGMSLGGFAGWMIGQSNANIGLELQVMLSALGSFIGAGGGYLFVWSAKKARTSGTTLPPRRFRRQIVGSCCVDCGDRIVLFSEGQICTDCHRLFCTKCEAKMPCSKCRNADSAKGADNQCLSSSTGMASSHTEGPVIAMIVQDSDANSKSEDAIPGGQGSIVVKQCQLCGTRVVPKRDGRCPACQHAM